MKISVIIPIYNEKDIISINIKKMEDYLNNNFENYELIIVDDGSTDFSIDKIRTEKAVIIKNKYNHGKGNALKCGVNYADGDYIFFTDADLPYPLEFIKNSTYYLKEYSIVCGKRTGKYPFYRKIFSACYDKTVKLFLGIDIKNIQCGIKGFTNSAAKDLFSKSKTNRFSIDTEIIYIAIKQNYKIKQIPVKISHRKETRVCLLKDTINMFINMKKIRKRYTDGEYNDPKKI